MPALVADIHAFVQAFERIVTTEHRSHRSPTSIFTVSAFGRSLGSASPVDR
jgi:hypothetical protein